MEGLVGVLKYTVVLELHCGHCECFEDRLERIAERIAAPPLLEECHVKSQSKRHLEEESHCHYLKESVENVYVH